MSDNNQTLEDLYTQIDVYLCIPLVSFLIFFFILTISMIIISLISFCFYILKKNFHQSMIMIFLVIISVFNIGYFIISIIQTFIMIFMNADDIVQTCFTLWSVFFAVLTEASLGLMFSYLSFMYSKTLRDLNIIGKCVFTITIIILIFLCILVGLTVVIAFISSVVSFFLVIFVQDIVEYVMIFFYVVILPSMGVIFIDVFICCVFVFICSIRLVFFIFRLMNKINNFKSKMYNFLNLLKIVSLVLSINFIYTFHLECFLCEVIFIAVGGHFFWIGTHFFYCLCTFLIPVLFFFSFSPSK